jgi:hypothetical protein
MHTSSSRLKPTRRLHKNSVRPRNVRPPKSLPATQPLRKSSRKGRPSRSRAARRDSAVHVSLSSDSLVKQPGTCAVPLSGEPESRRSSTLPIEIGSLDHRISVRCFTGATSRREADGAPYGFYIVSRRVGCQHLMPAYLPNLVPEPAATKPPLHSRLLAIRKLLRRFP